MHTLNNFKRYSFFVDCTLKYTVYYIYFKTFLVHQYNAIQCICSRYIIKIMDIFDNLTRIYNILITYFGWRYAIGEVCILSQ